MLIPLASWIRMHIFLDEASVAHELPVGMLVYVCELRWELRHQLSRTSVL